MSVQWTLIATFLYVEVFVVLLMVLPIASPKRWQRFFNSRLLALVRAQASAYFFILLAILILFLLDAIREMRKYSNPDLHGEGHQHLDAEMQGNMRLFRAQRNFYISGFALFLSLVIRRLVILISAQATLLAQAEANLRQAQSASTTARTLLAQKTSAENAENDTNEAYTKQISSLKETITVLQEELEKEKKDKSAMKTQSESLNKEYDRLTDEYNRLQKKLSVTGSTGDKKGD